MSINSYIYACMHACSVTSVMSNFFVTLQTVTHQVFLSMGFSRQEYWSGLPFASPGDLPNPGTEPRSSALWANSLTSEPPGKPWKIMGGKGIIALKIVQEPNTQWFAFALLSSVPAEQRIHFLVKNLFLSSSSLSVSLFSKLDVCTRLVSSYEHCLIGSKRLQLFVLFSVL